MTAKEITETNPNGAGAPMKVNKTNFVEALKNTGGLITTVAQKLKVDRKTVTKFLKRYPDMEEARMDAREVILDMAEGSLFKQIKQDEKICSIVFIHHNT